MPWRANCLLSSGLCCCCAGAALAPSSQQLARRPADHTAWHDLPAELGSRSWPSAGSAGLRVGSAQAQPVSHSHSSAQRTAPAPHQHSAGTGWRCLPEPRSSTRVPGSTHASIWRQPMGVDPDVNLRRPASTSRLTPPCVVGVNCVDRRRPASTGVDRRRPATSAWARVTRRRRQATR
jgi:hypothetical protein